MPTIKLNGSTIGLGENNSFLAHYHFEGAWYASEIHTPSQSWKRINVLWEKNWCRPLTKEESPFLYDGLIAVLKDFNSYEEVTVIVNARGKIEDFEFVLKAIDEINPEIYSYDKISNYGIF